MNELGCTDGGCWFRRNTGQVTNGGCDCVRAQSTYTSAAGWAIPVQLVQVMVALAAQIAVEKERANAPKNMKPTKKSCEFGTPNAYNADCDNSFTSVLFRRLYFDLRRHAGWDEEAVEKKFREIIERTLLEFLPNKEISTKVVVSDGC